MKSSLHQFGDLLIQLYEFEKAGDGLPYHQHDRATAHVTLVRKGKIEVKVEGEPTRMLEAGAIIDLPLGKRHSIMALVDGTQFANIRKYFAS